MPNIASVLRAEIARVARKEARAEIEGMKKVLAQQRSAVTSLRRRAELLEKQVKRTLDGKGAGHPDSSVKSSGEGEGTQLRFSAKGFASLRARLGISAAAMGQLLGVSPLSVYKWESGKARPRAYQLPKIAEVRRIGKRELMARLEGASGSSAEDAGANLNVSPAKKQRFHATKEVRSLKSPAASREKVAKSAAKPGKTTGGARSVKARKNSSMAPRREKAA